MPRTRIKSVSQNSFMYMCPIHAVVMVPVTPPPTPHPPTAYYKGHKDVPVKVLWKIILQASVELMKYACT